MVATGLATEVQRPRSTEVLRRFAAPDARPAFWIALWATAAVVELVALASIVLADEPVPGYRAPVPLDRRRVRRLRADRLAPAARQPQRPADGGDGLRAAGRAGVRAVEPDARRCSATCSRTRGASRRSRCC